MPINDQVTTYGQKPLLDRLLAPKKEGFLEEPYTTDMKGKDTHPEEE